MKKELVTVLACILLCLMIGCVHKDYASYATINVQNNSLYDLKLSIFSFDDLTETFQEIIYADDIIVRKNSTYSFRVWGTLGSQEAPDPNDSINRIVFINLHDHSILKDVENKNLFKFTNRIENRNYVEDVYALVITNELLQ